MPFTIIPGVDPETMKFPPELNTWQDKRKFGPSTNIYSLPSGAYSPNSAATATAVDLPTANNGTLLKHEWDNHASLIWMPATSRGNELWMNQRVGANWQGWSQINDAGVVTLTLSDNIDDLEDGVYTPNSNAEATTLNFPSANVGPMVQYSTNSTRINAQQVWWPISSVPRMYMRSKISGAWREWSVLNGKDPNLPNESSGGLERTMRVAKADARRGGRQGTNGVACFAMMFDHGSANFLSKIAPLLRELGFPCGWGLNSKMYDPAYKFYDSDQGTSFAQISRAAIDQGISIWNHGEWHDQDGAPEIINGRDQLTSSLPQLAIENWLHTGIYGDFESGKTFDKYWENDIGSVILNSHAYLTGDIQEHVKPLNGTIKPGYDGTWVDGGQIPLDALKSQIISAQKNGGAVMMRHHPMYIDTEGNMSLAQLTTFLHWVWDERDAGRLLVVTPDMLNLLDSSLPNRRNLISGKDSTVAERTVEMTYNQLAVGSVNEFHAIVRVATSGTVHLNVHLTSSPIVQKTFTVSEEDVYVDLRSFFTIPLDQTSNFTVSVTAGTATGLDVQKYSVYAA